MLFLTSKPIRGFIEWSAGLVENQFQRIGWGSFFFRNFGSQSNHNYEDNNEVIKSSLLV